MKESEEVKENKFKSHVKKLLTFLGKGLAIGRWEIKFTWKF